MYQIKIKAENIKHLFDLYYQYDYFDLSGNYITKPIEPNKPGKFFTDAANFTILDYADEVPSAFEKIEWRDNADAIVEFDTEEEALYFKLKYGH